MDGDTREFVVNGARYQVGRMNAAVGSWLLFKLIDSIRRIFAQNSASSDGVQPVQEEQSLVKREAATHALIQGMLMTLDRDLFEQVQREALRVVGQYAMVGEKEVVLPVLMGNGNLASVELKNDISTVVLLTSRSLYFNLSPFFLSGGLERIMSAQEVTT
jgi:hypothetical protein